MADDPHKEDEAGEDDLALHRSISARERVEAILTAAHMTTRQAVDALTAHMVESQGTDPYIVLASIAPEVAARFDEPAMLSEHREYVGPFVGRRAAERWAAGHYADKPAVVWSVAEIRRPDWVEADVRRLREATNPDDDD
jgi:hypothetical protein